MLLCALQVELRDVGFELSVLDAAAHGLAAEPLGEGFCTAEGDEFHALLAFRGEAATRVFVGGDCEEERAALAVVAHRLVAKGDIDVEVVVAPDVRAADAARV